RGARNLVVGGRRRRGGGPAGVGWAVCAGAGRLALARFRRRHGAVSAGFGRARSGSAGAPHASAVQRISQFAAGTRLASNKCNEGEVADQLLWYAYGPWLAHSSCVH